VAVALAAAALAGSTSIAPAGDAAKVREEAFRLLNEGVSAYTKGDYDTAEDRLARASAIALNNFRAYLYHGLALSRLGRYPEALTALEIALDLEPNHLQGLVAVGDAHLALGDVDEARAAYYRALKERSEFPAALDGLARTYEAAAELPKAVELFRRAIASDAGFAEAYTHLGELYLRQGRFREAVDLLAEAVAIRPDHADGLNRLAVAYGRLGMFNEAVATVERAIELAPGDPEHPATLGALQVDLGLLARARDSFARSLALDPAQPTALRGLAEIARREGRYDDALAHLDLALADARLRARVRADLLGDRDRIVAERDRFAALAEAESDDDADPRALRELADVYAGRGADDRAADLLLRAGVEDPTDLERLAYLLLRAERNREALDTYDRLLAGGAPRAEWRLNRGVALAGLGLDEPAIAAYSDALAVSRDPALSRRAGLYRANALLRTGRTAEAVEDYVAFLESAPDDEVSERVRRILVAIAPDRVPEAPPADPAADVRSFEEAARAAEGGS